MKQIITNTFLLVLGMFLGLDSLISQETNYPSMSIGGRIHYDINFMNQGDDSFTGQEE